MHPILHARLGVARRPTSSAAQCSKRRHVGYYSLGYLFRDSNWNARRLHCRPSAMSNISFKRLLKLPTHLFQDHVVWLFNIPIASSTTLALKRKKFMTRHCVPLYLALKLQSVEQLCSCPRLACAITNRLKSIELFWQTDFGECFLK